MKNKAILYYVYDPMCSWCWGYRATFLQLQAQLQNIVDIEYRLGGLAPDSDLPMPYEMQQFLYKTWQKISLQLDCEFNFDFWSHCQPRRSTYPACRAVLIAREEGLEQEMYYAIQRAYYLQAKNPSDTSTLIAIAISIGLDADAFAQRIDSDQLQQQLLHEVEKARGLPIQGFPSLVLATKDQLLPIAIDYKHWQSSYQEILTHL